MVKFYPCNSAKQVGKTFAECTATVLDNAIAQLQVGVPIVMHNKVPTKGLRLFFFFCFIYHNKRHLKPSIAKMLIFCKLNIVRDIDCAR